MTIERECAVLLPGPVPGGRANADDAGATIDPVNGSARIQVPRWIEPRAPALSGSGRHGVVPFAKAARFGSAVVDEAQTATDRMRSYGTDVDGRTRAAVAEEEPRAAVLA